MLKFLIINYMDNLVIVNESNIHGRGVFSIDNLPKGTTLTCDVMLIHKSELKYVKNMNLNHYLYPWDNNSASICMGFGSYFNHSINPNIKSLSIDKIRKTHTFITTTKIKKNTELTIKYGNTDFLKIPLWHNG